MKDTRIGAVNEGSPAEAAGLRPGDRVLSINGEPISEWLALQLKIVTSDGQPLELEVEDIYGSKTKLEAIPRKDEGAARASLGIEPFFSQEIGLVTSGMAADRAGLQEGDIILTYDDKPPDNETIGNLIETVKESPGRPMRFTISREGRPIDVTVVPDKVSNIDGVVFDGNVVVAVDETIAEGGALALKPGDVVTAVDGQPLTDVQVRDFTTAMLYEAQGEEIDLTIERPSGLLGNTETRELTVPLIQIGRIGVGFSPNVVEKFHPAKAFAKSLEEFEFYLKLAVVTPYYLLKGRLSGKEIAGPIGIAVMTEQSRRLGLGYYLNLMGIIAIHLGILNLLPIPLLDGGQICISAYEGIRRKPLKEKYLILFQKIGIVLIGFIFLLATYNDIFRLIRVFMGGEFFE